MSPMPSWLQYDGRIVYANPACVQFLGAATVEEISGKRTSEFVCCDLSPDQQVLPTRSITAVRVDGSRREADVTSWPVPFGDDTAMQVTFSSTAADTQYLRNVLNSLFAFVGVLDGDGILLEANRAPLDAAGIRAEEVIGKPFPDAYWWSYSPAIQEQLREAIRKAQGGEPSRYDVPIRVKDDARMVIDFMLTPMRNEAGIITHLIPSAVDVTERVRAEQALRDSEQRFRGTFENAAVGIAHVDPAGRWLAMNQRLCEIVGYSKQELLKRTFQEITHPDDLQGDLNLAGLLGAGKIPSYQLEKRYLRGDGGIVWANLTGSSVRDSEGRLLYFIAVVEDISERKAAEDALRRSDAEFQALANSIPQLVWMAKPDGTAFWHNRRWHEYTGTDAGATFSGALHREDAAAVNSGWTHSLQTGKPFDMTLRMRGADGKYRPFLTRIIALKEEGQVVRWFGTATDISEQRAVEDALRAANDELQQFAFAVSHDLQEPLRMVHLYSELLIRRFATEQDDDAREFAGIVQSGVWRMSELIRDLLDYSRVIHTKGDWIPRRVDLGSIISETLQVFAKQIDDEGAQVTVGEMPWTNGDRTQLSQVFQNLVGNALKYRRPGERASVRIGATRAGAEWIIEVRDEGIGFKQDYAEHIFGLFKRLHKEDYPGTGLGLAICRRIVDAHGGRIWAESQEGKGATFFLALPVLDEDSHE
jgi:PAS domain S-box-containing protein